LQQVVWPTDLCTLDGDAMVIRETTHRFSRLSFHRSMVGRRLPLLMTATGRAYFAFCPPAEREELIELMVSREDEQSTFAADHRFVERLVEHTLSKGYGENNSHWGEERKIAAIAIPITYEARVMGCLNLVYIAKAMPVEEAARRYLPAMRSVVEQIQAQLG
jgi:IclR family mhp operon transcriptional activator